MTRRLAITLALLSATTARAQSVDETPEKPPIPPALEGIEIEEHLGARVPGDLPFVDETGKLVELKDALAGGKPVILTLAYYSCPQLCNLVVSGVVASLRDVDLVPGRDYRLVTVSIDPGETPKTAMHRQRGHLQTLDKGAQPSDWPFLTGREPQIRTLADAVGFKYRWDPATRSYAHAATIMLLSPDGRVTRYLYGFRFTPRDLKLAILEAGQGKVGTSLDRVLLSCYKYDAAKRRYGFVVFGVLRIGGGLVFLALLALLVRYWRREHRARTITNPDTAHNDIAAAGRQQVRP